MSWTENICKKHDGFVHTGSNCIMCVEDAALQRGADAARRECAGIVRDWQDLSARLWDEKYGEVDPREAIEARVGKPVDKESGE